MIWASLRTFGEGPPKKFRNGGENKSISGERRGGGEIMS